MTYRSGLLAAILFAALTGCGRLDEPMSGESAILFNAVPFQHGAIAVKSGEGLLPSQESDLIHTGNQVSIFGSWTSPAGVATDIFSGVTLTCEGTGTELDPFHWSYAPLRYWRSTGTYTFGSVYPSSTRVEYGTSGGKLVATYSMLADDYDLMIASTSRDMDHGGGTGTVTLNFHHACSAVRFLFQKAEGSGDYFIDSFELQHLSAVGRLVAEGSTLSWTPAESRSSGIYKWQAATESARIAIPEAYDKSATNAVEQWHFAIPQTLLSNTDNAPAVKFSVQVGEDTTPVYTTLSLPTEEMVGGDMVPIAWEAGKMYTYYIQIQPSRAYIIVTVDPWDEYYLGVDDIAF